jgi:PAS domain-containing protein
MISDFRQAWIWQIGICLTVTICLVIGQFLNHPKIGLITGSFLASLIGSVVVRAVVQENVASRAVAAGALQACDEKYRTLLDAIHDYAIFMLDPQGRVVSWNAGAERIKGYTAELMVS